MAAPLGIEGRSAGKAVGSSGLLAVTIPSALGTKVMSGRGQPQYQGGSSFTVFSAQGSNPLANCKLCGRGIQKVYDKTVKGYVYACTGAHTSKLQLPKDESKAGLQLVHPFMVLQILVPAGQHFTLELRVIRNTWLSLALHVTDLFYNCFRVMSFRSVDVVVLGAVCKLRKIFTMRNRLADTASGIASFGIEEPLPHEHMFAAGVEAAVQVIDSAKLQSALGIEVPSFDGAGRGGPESVLSARKLTLNNKLDNSKQVHVAFGSRMPLTVQPSATPGVDERLEKVPGKDKETLARPPEDPSLEISKTVGDKIPLKSSNPRSATPVPFPPKKCENSSSQVGESPKPETASQDASGAVEYKSWTVVKGARTAKKKEEVNWKRDGQALSSAKHGRKEAELGKVKEFRQQARYEDSPPITPCGWERCASARGSDDMSFKVHTLFEKLGDYARSEETEESLRQTKEGEAPCATLAQAKQVSSSKEPRADGLKFYQFELEKDFMLKEETSASASDDDLSWCSGSSGRASANAIKDLANFVKGAHLVGKQEAFDEVEAEPEKSKADGVETSADNLFIVHDEQDENNIQTGKGAEVSNFEELGHMPFLEVESRDMSPASSCSPHKRSRFEQSEARQEECEPSSEVDLELLYDPTLDCYYDPKTNRYYELLK